MSSITKIMWYSVVLFCCILPISKATGQTNLFNAGWRFHKGDVQDAQRAGFNDKSWRTLDLPHDWSIEGPFSKKWASGTGYLPAGIGWYRKTFAIPSGMKNKQISIYFDGVYKCSEVWINGHHLGIRPNGYTPFWYSLTPYLNKEGNNIIAVKVDHSDFADSRWYPGTGINRNVYLIAKNPVHLETWGVTFTTPEVSASLAKAKIGVILNNNSVSSAAVEVKASLINASGKVCANSGNSQTIAAGDTSESALSLTVQDPELWSTDQPYLYQLVISVFANGQKTDELTQQVGLRNIRFDANEGFFLNDKNMKLKGVCIHHDAGALGSAVPEEVWARRLQKLKEAGCNAIRMSHYPHQDYLYDLCDKMGFLVMDEAFDEWEYGKNKWIEGWNKGKPGKDGYHTYFKEWAERDLRDMIRSHRNHPSIIMWSIGNEIDYPNDPYSHPILDSGRNAQIYKKGYLPDHPPASELGVIAKKLVAVVKANDPSRPVTAALAGISMSNQTAYPGLLDIVGYNYQEYLYQDDHRQYPNRIIYGSENSRKLSAWQAVDTSKYISGQFLWTGVDFMGEARAWPVRSSGAGLLNLAGFPKTDYYFRQSLWTEKPMVYLLAFKKDSAGKNTVAIPSWNWQTGDIVGVQCISNADEVELFLNGKSLGRKPVKKALKNEVYWYDQEYRAGELEVRAYHNEKEVSRYALKTAGKVSAIEAVTDRPVFSTEKKDLAHIEISLQDKEGRPVYLSDNEITINIEGPAILLGLESGDLSSHEDYKSNKRKAYNGRLLAYIQSQQKAGTIKITLSSPGLVSKTILIQSK